jgi:hypothetical protein
MALLTLEYPHSGIIKQAPVGYSWTTLFFPTLPARLRAILKRLEQMRDMPCEPERDSSWRSVLPFSCPPDWVHLKSAEAMIAEGKSQHNCLTEPSRYLREDCYLFKTFKPVRATLLVHRGTDGVIRLDACLLRSNGELGTSSMLCVRETLTKTLAASGGMLALSKGI